MNKACMKSPVLSQLYSHKLIQSVHLKKLENIKQSHRTQFSIDKNRTNLINSIRKHKAHSFAANFNKQSDTVSKTNISILKKLGEVKPSPISQHQKRPKTYSCNDLSSRNRSRVSQRVQQFHNNNEKENNRLFVKIKSVSSTIKTQKLNQQYLKNQRLKERLMRYSYEQKNSQEIKIQLKSQRLISMKNSYLGCRRLTSNYYPQVRNKEIVSNTVVIGAKQNKNKNLAKYYKRQDIAKFSISKLSKRYHTINLNQKSDQDSKNTLRIRNTAQNIQENQDQGIFLTKPLKQKLIPSNKALVNNAKVTSIKYNKAKQYENQLSSLPVPQKISKTVLRSKIKNFKE